MIAQSEPINSSPLRSGNRSLWLKWTLASGIGLSVGSVVYHVLATVLIKTLSEDKVPMLQAGGIVLEVLYVSLVVLILALMQGFVLKYRISSIAKFVRATCIGGVIGGGLSGIWTICFIVVLPSYFDERVVGIVDMIGAGVIIGLAIGYYQQGLLRVKRNWMVFGALGWAIGLGLTSVFEGWLSIFTILYEDLVSVVLLYFFCGLVIGAVAGYPLMHVLQQPKSKIGNPK